MEHRPLEVLRQVAEVRKIEHSPMSRRSRLERWAEVLASEPQRRLKSLQELELLPRSERHELRADNSPLSVAYADSVLRAEGLRSDKLGDGMDFFDLSEREAHRLLCSCMNGMTMAAEVPARRLRRMAAAGQTLRTLVRAVVARFKGASVPVYLVD